MDGDPYYPVPRAENAELYKKYQLLTGELPNVYFTGRLATYKYYNMDQVVAQSLTLFKRIQSASQKDQHVTDETKTLFTS
jgi:UDP-galactopyranose mutase